LSVVIDAQRGEFYLAGYETSGGSLEEVSSLRIISRAEVEKSMQVGGVLLGPDAAQLTPAGQKIYPSALMLAGLASGRTDFVAGCDLAPIYLREASTAAARALKEGDKRRRRYGCLRL
jgi:tRNA A37 threonylcarbamoyladenosine modification protein TsaB